MNMYIYGVIEKNNIVILCPNHEPKADKDSPCLNATRIACG